MVFFSGCKINLGLRIVRKRDDGFHDIETIFYPVPWNDAIEYLPSDKTNVEVLGRKIDGDANDNTVTKAYNSLKQNHELPPLSFKLLKNVPSGAGLGGGSANAAAVLKQLNDDFDLKLSQNALVGAAASIGSDCAFFIRNKPYLATGKGEQLNDVDVNLNGYWLLVIFPNVHIDTAWAYRSFAQRGRYNATTKALSEVIRQPVEQWKETLRNDFEDLVFAAHPNIKNVKEELYRRGAAYASLSGSGSAVYGLFRERPDAADVGGALGIPGSDWFLRRLD